MTCINCNNLQHTSDLKDELIKKLKEERHEWRSSAMTYKNKLIEKTEQLKRMEAVSGSLCRELKK